MIRSEIRVESSLGLGGVEGQPQLEEDVLEAHHAQAHRAPVALERPACSVG